MLEAIDSIPCVSVRLVTSIEGIGVMPMHGSFNEVSVCSTEWSTSVFQIELIRVVYCSGDYYPSLRYIELTFG